METTYLRNGVNADTRQDGIVRIAEDGIQATNTTRRRAPGRKAAFMLLGLLFLFATPAMAQDIKLTRISRVALYSSSAIDLGYTWHAMSRGAVEMNPVLGQSRVRQGFVVVGSTVAADLINRSIGKRHPKLAVIFNFAATGLHLAVTARNWKVMHPSR